MPFVSSHSINYLQLPDFKTNVTQTADTSISQLSSHPGPASPSSPPQFLLFSFCIAKFKERQSPRW